jgi:hypothetical protein
MGLRSVDPVINKPRAVGDLVWVIDDAQRVDVYPG